MALNEHDREDLLRDGKMMPLRGEAVIDGVVVTAGFRNDGQLSLYFGQDEVFQFNSASELRRVYQSGNRYAASNGTLVRLEKSHDGGRVVFLQQAIDSDELQRILHSLASWLKRLENHHTTANATWEVADDLSDAFKEQLSTWLRSTPRRVKIAKTANA